MAGGAAEDRAERERRMRAEVDEIRRRMNAQAASLAARLLPNGRKSGRYWETSNIRDEKTGGYSLKVRLDTGGWQDFGLPKGAPGAGGDMLSLYVEREHGGDFAAAITAAKKLLGMHNMSEAEFARARAASAAQQQQQAKRNADEDARRRSAAEALWHGAVPIAGPDGDTPALRYLAGRGISFDGLGRVPGSLRYHPQVWSSEIAERDGRAHAKVPGMVCGVFALDGSMPGVHRHYLDVSAGKAGPVTKRADLGRNAKKTLGPSLGGHIPLWKGAHRHTLREIPAGTDIYMSEGVEDGLSVAICKPEARVIAGVALAKMAFVQLPPQMGALIIIGQNDPPGSDAAQTLEAVITAHQAQGRTVRAMFPPERFKDFNDMLCGREKG